MILIKPAGSTLPRVEKRAIESIVYVLDCSELLEKAELIVSVEAPPSQNDIQLSEARSRKGRNIEVRIDNPPLTTAQYLDYTIPMLFHTTSGNRKAAVFQVRVHK